MLGNYPIGRADPGRQRSLKRRLPNARSGTFKRLAGFDYDRPKELDRALLDELFTWRRFTRHTQVPGAV